MSAASDIPSSTDDVTTSMATSATAGGGVGTPIFVTGWSRSGTTWVNRLFRDYFDAGFVNEGQFIVSFGRRLSHYGNLKSDRNHQRLIRDLRIDPFFAILRRNYAVEIDWLRTTSIAPDFAAIVLDILTQIAEQTGKIRIGSKYPVFGRHLGLLNQLFPDCRVVHVIRDGRDCALSQKHVVWGHQNTYASAVHWRDYLHKAREGAKAMPGRYLEIRYEDLLATPRPSIERLEAFVTGGPAGAGAERFMRDAKKLRTDKIAGWQRTMSPRAQSLFEGVAGEALRGAGYPLTGIVRAPSALVRGLYIAHDRLSREAWHWARKVFPNISEYK